MTTATTRRRPWGLLLAEAGLIIVSILLAFAIEAWWDGRQEAAARSDLLLALEEDFSTTEAGLDAALASAEHDVARTGGYLRAVVEDLPLSRDSLLALVGGVGGVTFFEPSMAAYSAAAATGELELVRDPVLSAAFTEFDLALRNYDEYVAISNDMFFTGPTHDLRRAMGGFHVPAGGSGPDLFEVEVVVPPDFDLRSDVVAASVEAVYWVQAKILDSLRSMDTAAGRILAELTTMLD